MMTSWQHEWKVENKGEEEKRKGSYTIQFDRKDGMKKITVVKIPVEW